MSVLVFIKPLVERVLRDPHTEWSVQGFGMMRTYFGPSSNPKEFRLNLWDSRLAVPNVSVIHDHPWHFESIIVSGEFRNTRFEIDPNSTLRTHSFSTIKTGIGGDNSTTISDPQHCHLVQASVEEYFPGGQYSQIASEIHMSEYARGTVTLNKRTKVGDGEHARVFWPYGTPWIDAAPRLATPEEVAVITENALLSGF